MRQNGQIMKRLMEFVDQNIMVEGFGLIPDGNEHRPSPMVIETLTAFLKVCVFKTLGHTYLQTSRFLVGFTSTVRQASNACSEGLL